MTSQQKIALTSVVAAIGLIALKLMTGLITGSLAFISGALESGLDLVTALMTLFSVSVAVRPADEDHPWGHAKVENLTAIAEASVLFVVSLWIAYAAAGRLSKSSPPEVDATWWAILVILIVIAIDVSRTFVSFRASVEHRSPALQGNALNFFGDFLGSVGVLVGLVFVRAGFPQADAIAALFVGLIIIQAAIRLAYRNANILMDRSPGLETEAVRQAIAAIDPPVELKRLRVREAGGHYYADAVIGVSPEAAVGEGHAVADRIEQALEGMLYGGEVVVHVEPRGQETDLAGEVRAAAMSVKGVREIHNLVVVDIDDRCEVSLHMKLPGELRLDEAHDLASQVEHSIMEARPEIAVVQTHLEPWTEAISGSAPHSAETHDCGAHVRRIVREVTGSSPRLLRFIHTEEGLVAYLTLSLDPSRSLAEAHDLASQIETRVRSECHAIGQLIVHTEP